MNRPFELGDKHGSEKVTWNPYYKALEQCMAEPIALIQAL